MYKTLKWGTWPFNDKVEDEILFSISDEDLEGLDEYKDFKKQKTN